MKRLCLILLPILALGATAQAADPPQHAPSRAPLRPVSDCIDTSRINEWHIIDDRTLTVRTGPHRFLLKTQHECPRLGRYGGGLSFRPSPDKQVTLPRICGDYGDLVSSRDQPPCSVESVRLIDKEQFDALTRHARRNGSGAEQNLPHE